MSVELEEFEPGRWRVKKPRVNEKRRAKNMPLPFVISDTMEPTEQIDGKFYTSKCAFRAVGKAHGLTEVGTERFKPKRRGSTEREFVEKRRRNIKEAIEKAKAGQRSS